MTEFAVPPDQPLVVESIASLLKESVAGLDSAEVSRLAEDQFSRIRLLEASGQWTCEAARKVAETVLGQEPDGSTLAARVDSAAQCVMQNPILMQLFRSIPSDCAKELRRKAHEQGATVLPQILAYSLVLERLSQAMYDDWHVAVDLGRVWARARKATRIERFMSAFDHAKLASVQYAMRRCIAHHASGSVPADFGRFILPLNIVEACLEDLRLGYTANAACGFVLARHHPGRTHSDRTTGAGPTRWSDDRKGIAVYMEFPQQWADLYSSWNLAFVSHYAEFPFIMAKLLIPFVADYQQHPEQYIYRRALALWTHLHHLYLGRADQARTGTGAFVWNDDQISKIWGQVNREAAARYAADVQRARCRR